VAPAAYLVGTTLKLIVGTEPVDAKLIVGTEPIDAKLIVGTEATAGKLIIWTGLAKRGGNGGNNGTSGSADSSETVACTCLPASAVSRSESSAIRDQTRELFWRLPQQISCKTPATSKPPPMTPRQTTRIQAGCGKFNWKSLSRWLWICKPNGCAFPVCTECDSLMTGNICIAFAEAACTTGLGVKAALVDVKARPALWGGAPLPKWDWLARNSGFAFAFALNSAFLCITAMATPPATAAAAPTPPRTSTESTILARNVILELWSPEGSFLVELREEGAASISGALFMGNGASDSSSFDSGSFPFDPGTVFVRFVVEF